MSKFNELVTKLREIFQIDRPELDFGVYRILNARADEINEYLEKRLKEKVEEALASGSAANLEQLKEELKKAEQGAQALGVDADTVPKVQELKAKISEATSGSAEHENAVFSHLLTFFSRYYDQGDFISQRRYKGDTYAIPYAGEEVMLHWANKDQYYIKTGENFSNYSFKLDDGRVVHFRLVSADTAKDNRKDNDKERRFVLAEHKVISRLDDDGDEYEEEVLPVEEVLTTDAEGNETKELIIRFEYKVMPKGSKQDKLVEAAVESVLANEAVANRWLDIGRRAPTEKKPKRTLLEKQLTNYTTKNTADYFIHKNLGKFLRLELDFYIKNEVMHLDDVQNSEVFSDIEKSLRMIQCLRGIALDLIKFLAQLEDFQKKLWTKKKFVISSHYSITLDRIPEELYEDIMANEKQWNHWKRLGSWDGSQKTMSELLSNKYRMVDTGLFDNSFKSRLLASLSNIDSELDGLLIHGDNFQGISSLKGGWENSVSAIYIDPPYNTDASPIVYKNGYQHSTWASLFFGRMSSALDLLKEGSLVCVAIDDFEYPHQYLMMNDALGLNHIGTAAVRSKPQGRPTASGFSTNHEYAVFWSATEKPALGRMPREGTKANRYPFSDDKGLGTSCYTIRPFAKRMRQNGNEKYNSVYFQCMQH